MNSTIKTLFLGLLLIVGPMSVANASITLGNWNDADLQASGDYVNVNTGVDNFENTWFSLQWMPGSNNSLTALGVDTVFYNSSYTVSAVWLGAIDTGTNVTSKWTTNYGGVTGGGGFGDFLSEKSLDGGTVAGVSEPIFFVLNGYTNFSTTNKQGALFDVHVRYTQNCSGWVSDGATNSVTSGSCGSSSVPEPGSLLLLGMGLLGIGLVRRKNK